MLICLKLVLVYVSVTLDFWKCRDLRYRTVLYCFAETVSEI